MQSTNILVPDRFVARWGLLGSLAACLSSTPMACNTQDVPPATRARSISARPPSGVTGTLPRYPPPATTQRLPPESWPKALISPRGGYGLTLIPGGTFTMGSGEHEPGHSPAETPSRVITLDPFYLGTHEVTNAEYRRFIAATGGREPDHWRSEELEPKQPVVGITWHEARAYAQWAGLVLPTEAQWEYAARAGTRTRYALGEATSDLLRSGHCDKGDVRRSFPYAVGGRAANAWGLFDMHGNVWEWVADRWGPYDYEPAVGDGLRQPDDHGLRVIRGGSWKNSPRLCRSASRSAMELSHADRNLGFRAASSGPPDSQLRPFTSSGFVRGHSPFPGDLDRPDDDAATHPGTVLLHGSRGGSGNF